MPDLDARPLAPFRAAVQAVAEAGALLRGLGRGTGFLEYLGRLDALPDFVAFQPFADSARWSVDLAGAEAASASEAEARRAFSLALGDKARRRRLVTLAAKPAAGADHRGGAPDRPGEFQGGSPAPAAAPRGAADAGVAAWSALAGIARQVAALDAMSSAPGNPPAASPTGVAAPDVRAAAAGESARRSRGAARNVATGAPPAARLADPPPMPPSFAEAAAGVADFTAVATSDSVPESAPLGPLANALLESLVSDLWPATRPSAPGRPGQVARGRAATAASAPRQAGSPLAGIGSAQAAADQPGSATTTAPRAPSLLLAAARLGAGAVVAGAAPAPGRDRRASAWPANEALADEAVLERLNQSLIDQAWLRGVDLT